MAKGKEVRVRAILECTSCVRNGVNKESRGISRYITQKNRHNYTQSIGIEKILSLLLQAYTSWGDKKNR